MKHRSGALDRDRAPRRRALKALATLSQNPDAPGCFTIFHRDHARFFWRILFLRGRSNESARSAQCEAEHNDRDLRQQVHRLIPTLSPVFQAEACPKRRR
jgi:hypothetical protein